MVNLLFLLLLLVRLGELAQRVLPRKQSMRPTRLAWNTISTYYIFHSCARRDGHPHCYLPGCNSVASTTAYPVFSLDTVTRQLSSPASTCLSDTVYSYLSSPTWHLLSPQIPSHHMICGGIALCHHGCSIGFAQEVLSRYHGDAEELSVSRTCLQN